MNWSLKFLDFLQLVKVILLPRIIRKLFIFFNLQNSSLKYDNKDIQ